MDWNLLDKQQEFLKLLDRQGKSFNTVKNYKADLQCFNNFLLDKQGNMKMKSFSATQVQEYSQFLGNKYGSPNSVRRRVQALRLFFDFLMVQEIFPDNPLKKMAVSAKVLDAPKPSPFPEVIKVYQLLKKRVASTEGITQLVQMRNVVIFHLIYGSGLKVSDMTKLHQDSILKDNKSFRVMVEHPKRDPYSIPLPLIFREDYLLYRNKFSEIQKTEGLEIEELLFNANPYRILAGGLSPRGIELFFEEVRREFKTEMTAKSLRQSCIFKWLNLSVSHVTIKEWLGVTPAYSLDLYLEEMKKDSSDYVFNDLGDVI